jgi:transposase
VAAETNEHRVALLDRVGELEARLVARDAELSVRDKQIAELTAQVQVLREKLDQNSGNSNRPPSSDGPGAAKRGVGRRGGSSKAKNKRKRGAQKGHRGASRVLVATDQIQNFVEFYPPACEFCSAALPETPDADPTRHQFVDLSPHAPHVTEFRRHEVACTRCNRRTRAAYDKNKIPSLSFGPRLTGVVIMLTGVYHLSRDRTRQLLMELFGIKISVGTISAMEARASEAMKSAVVEAHREVANADVKHTDATSWLMAGVTMSLWTLATVAATVYRIFENGRRDTIETWFGNLVGILVSDRASVFGFWAMERRQICHAHLIRRFVSFSQRDGPAGAMGRELLDLSALVFEYWHGFKAGVLTRDEMQAWMRPVVRKFDETLRRAEAANIPRVSGSCRNILAHGAALWTYLVHEGVEPTNNHAELQLRPLVLWRRCSFGCQSERGLRFVERVMTVTFTARKQGKNVLDFFTRCIAAQRDGTTPPSLIATAAA